MDFETRFLASGHSGTGNVLKVKVLAASATKFCRWHDAQASGSDSAPQSLACASCYLAYAPFRREHKQAFSL